MKTKGVDKIREALGSYVGFLKTGVKPYFYNQWSHLPQKVDFNPSFTFLTQSSHREWFCQQLTVWPSLRPPRSPKPRWIKRRLVPTTFPAISHISGPLTKFAPSHPVVFAAMQQDSQDFFCGCFEQISSSSSSVAPVNTGVKIPTCKFTLKDKFLTSPADLYRVFLNQEVCFSCFSISS